MNICIILINIHNLAKLLYSNKHYDLVDGSEDEGYFSYFLNFYKKDIAQFFPENYSLTKAERAYIVCCDAAPVGLFTGRMEENGNFEVGVDYAVPKFRDCSIGKFLYPALGEKGGRKSFAGSTAQNMNPI